VLRKQKVANICYLSYKKIKDKNCEKIILFFFFNSLYKIPKSIKNTKYLTKKVNNNFFLEIFKYKLLLLEEDISKKKCSYLFKLLKFKIFFFPRNKYSLLFEIFFIILYDISLLKSIFV
jgi:hypothetical protein